MDGLLISGTEQQPPAGREGSQKIIRGSQVVSLEEKVISIISKNVEKKQPVALSHDLVADLGADSLAVIMIIQALEDEFDISIEDEDFRKIRTVGEIVEKLRAGYPAIENET